VSAWPTPILGGFPLERTLLARRLHARARILRPIKDFTALTKLDDRARVCVRGRLRARAQLPALLSDDAGVARRVDLRLQIDHGPWWDLVHFAAQDLELVDDSGTRLPVTVARDTVLLHRLTSSLAPLQGDPLLRVLRLAFPAELTRQFYGHAVVRASEELLRDGDVVAIAGDLTRTADVAAHAVGRHTAWTPVLAAAVLR
jgi:hypothetical protein